MKISGTQIMKPVKTLFNSDKFNSIAETTKIAVAVETTLKAVGRPTFIFMDKNADPESKKYAASKEFLYQMLCLGIYLTFLGAMKHKGYNLIKKIITSKKTELLKNFDGYEAAQKALKELKNSKNIEKYNVAKEQFKKDVKNEFKVAKGAEELSSIICSVLALTVLAPQISHFIIHPLMNLLGLKQKPKTDSSLNNSTASSTNDNIFKSFEQKLNKKI